jgi:hypothetical protein
MSSPQEIVEKINEDPVFFLDHCLACEHWSVQDKILMSVFYNNQTTVRGCHGFGKTYTAARAALAFLYAKKDSIVITTAPTFRQVENVMWREIRGAVAKASRNLGGKVLKTQLDISENWYALGMSADKPDTFQGIHSASGNILVVVDEAAGVAEDMLEVIEAILTSKNAHLLYIGNPTNAVGKFYRSFKNRFFKKFKVSVFDTPNFLINNIKSVDDLKKFKDVSELRNLKIAYEQLVTPEWAWKRIEDWGEDSSIFKSRVLAEFPEESDDTLIPLRYVEAALVKEIETSKNENFIMRKQIGIDVARFGNDTSVFTAIEMNMRNEYNHIKTRWCSKRDTMEVSGNAISLFKELGFSKKYDYFVVDDTGLGGGVTDRLRELGYNVRAVNFASRASSTKAREKYNDIKAEMYWGLREIFRDGRIKLRDEGRICAEIPTVLYTYDSSGRIDIVGKEKMKKLGFRSPDFADSFALACFGFAKLKADVYIKKEATSQKRSERNSKTIAGNIFNETF